MNINDLMEDAVKKQLESEETKEFIQKQAKQMVNNAIKNCFSKYNGVGEKLEDKLKENMIPMIERFNYSDFTVKLDALLTEVINEQTKSNSDVLANFKQLVDDIDKNITIKDIVDKWIEYAEKNIDTLDLEPCVDDPDSYETVEYNINYEKNINGTDLEITLSCEKDPSLDKEINFYHTSYSYTDNYYRIWKTNQQVTLNSIKNLDDFSIFIHALKMNDIKFDLDINDLDDLLEESKYKTIQPKDKVEYSAVM